MVERVDSYKSFILETIFTHEDDKHSVHSISFGNDADFSLLKSISVQNEGLARKVYEDSDAELQLTGFYDEISSPLLAKLKIAYLNETVDPDSVVHDADAIYSEGSEVVTVGKVNEAKFSKSSTQIPLTAKVTAFDASSASREFRCGTVVPCWDVCYPRYPPPCPVPLAKAATENGNGTSASERRPYPPCIRPPPCHFPCPPPPTPKPQYDPLPADSVGGFVERMWAYLTIQKLLEEANYGGVTEEVKKEKTNKALDMSLRYNFVTELTSMVVVKPNEEEKEEVVEEVDADDSAADTSPANLFAAGGGAAPPPRSAGPLSGLSLSGFGGGGAGSRSNAAAGPQGAASKPIAQQTKILPAPILPADEAEAEPFERAIATGQKAKKTRTRPQQPQPTQTPMPRQLFTTSTKLQEKKEDRERTRPTFSYNTTEATDFNVNWNTTSRDASSRDECARMCHADKKCKVALFTPAFRNCLLAYEGHDVFSCSKGGNQVPANKPVVLYCISSS